MLSLRSVVETGHPRLGTTVCDPSESIIISGNSGSDFIFYDAGRGFNNELAIQFPSVTTNITKNTFAGSSINWRWDQNTLARSGVSDYSALIITADSTSANLGANSLAAVVKSYSDLWVDHYWQNANGGNGAGKVWFLGTQPRTDRVDYIGNCLYRHELWSVVQDQSNLKRPSNCPRVQIIPVYFAFQKIHADQQNGITPSATFFNDLYSDPFHLHSTGRYIHLVMHMACLFGIDPRNVTPVPHHIDDNSVPMTLTESEYIRNVCYDVMHWTERHGVDVTAWDN